jgi:hypothetical protein
LHLEHTTSICQFPKLSANLVADVKRTSVQGICYDVYRG